MSIYKTKKTHQEKPLTLDQCHPCIEPGRSTGNGWHLKATHYPTGDVEVVALKLDPETHLKGGGAKRKTDKKSSMEERTLKESQRRSRKTVYAKILTLNADTLLTLTYRENQEDIDQSWKDFRQFNKLMKKRYKEKWQYVCVPERQERGAIHFHLAVKGFYNWNVVRAIWRKVVGEGNVDFKRRKDKKGYYVVNPKRIARYLSKYLTKQDMVEFNRRRYSSSSIQLPEPMIGWLALGMSVHQVMATVIKSLTRKSISTVWENENGYIPIVFLST